MILFVCLLLYATYSWSMPTKIIVHDPLAQQTYATEFEQDNFNQDLHRLLLTPLTTHVPNPKQDWSFINKKVNIDGQVITRSTPVIDGIPVEGADGIYNNNQYSQQFHYTHLEVPRAYFRLSAAECMEKAISLNSHSLITNPYVEKTIGAYEQIWLMHFGELRPVFKIRLPTISVLDLKDIYIDAENGEVLRIDDVAQLISAPAHLFVYSPKSPMLDKSELRRVVLRNLVELKDGGFLKGEYVNVRTCCRYFTCPDEGSCSDEEKRCALKSHNNVRETREILNLSTATLGLDPLMSLPETITVDTVRCTYLPFARASVKKDNNEAVGFFDNPVDQPGIESEMDRFSEIQAYFSVMSFFNNIRALLNDETWCLRKEAMSCNSDGSPELDENGLPKNAYRVFVNQLIPDMKIEGPNRLDSDNFLNQLAEGKGTADNPIKLDHFTRIGNAAFIPALSTLRKNAPRADEILSDLIKPYDHNVFFQGERDFAYDGDVVFHEFMHAITTSLISKINSLGLDEWGIHSEPGSLNEAWADYFAAAFTEDPALGEYASIKGGYGEVALRNINSQAACPNDVIGEIHNDGLIWSGALWEIRSTLKQNYGPKIAFEFDRAVLSSLAEAKTTEDFQAQGEKLINNIRARESLGDQVADYALEVLKKRGITSCFRAITLASVDENNRLSTRPKNLLFVPSKNQIGLKNYAPATAQLEIGIPAGATNMTLTWRQYLGGTGALLGTETTPESTKNAEPIGVLTSLDEPIKWKFQKTYAIATSKGQEITHQTEKAQYLNGLWQYSLPINFEDCEQRTIYVSLLSNDFKYVLENLNVRFDIDETKDLSSCNFQGSRRGVPAASQNLIGCSTTDKSSSLWLITLIALFLIKKRWSAFYTPPFQFFAASSLRAKRSNLERKCHNTWIASLRSQ